MLLRTELGHAVGLGHVTDNLLTMHPTSFAGETLEAFIRNRRHRWNGLFISAAGQRRTYLGASARV